MPLIYDYTCIPSKTYKRTSHGLEEIPQGGCDFAIRGYGGPYQFVKLDGGKEEVLPHPLEREIAKSLTGKDLDQLAKERRISFRNTKICLKCLKTEEECDCEKPDLIEIPKLEGMKCPRCHKGTISKIRTGIS